MITKIQTSDGTYEVGQVPSSIASKFSLSGKQMTNLTIGSAKHINLEPAYVEGSDSGTFGDILLKPGDDISLYSHHRALSKQDEVSLKVLDGNDAPVKLQVNASEALLTTKGKSGDKAEVFDLTVNKGPNERGYLKVRARAIDLRCEEHGGIALQPKGRDSKGNINKIKFEHGGGDGLEFGTFNTQASSLFTKEYRFNKNGIVKMATRVEEDSDKKDLSDITTYKKYVKQADDFYDVVDQDDAFTTWNDIIKTADVFNNGMSRRTKFDKERNRIEIYANNTYTINAQNLGEAYEIQEEENKFFITAKDEAEANEFIDLLLPIGIIKQKDVDDLQKRITSSSSLIFPTDGTLFILKLIYNKTVDESNVLTNIFYSVTLKTDIVGPSIKIATNSKLDLEASKISFTGEVNFGKSISFGELQDGMIFQKKDTKKGAGKSCDMLKVEYYNNGKQPSGEGMPTFDASNFEVETILKEADVTPVGEKSIIAQCSVYDVIKLVNYMKINNLGPWAD